MIKEKFLPATKDKSCKKCRFCKWEKRNLKFLFSGGIKTKYCTHFKDKWWRIIFKK